MKIAIRFGDNDFHNTFFGVLQMLLEGWKWRGGLPNDKERICFLVNILAPVAYLTHQNGWEDYDLQNSGPIEQNIEYIKIKEYLTVPIDRILLDEEVDEYLKNNFDDNGSTFVLDTGLYNSRIYSI